MTPAQLDAADGESPVFVCRCSDKSARVMLLGPLIRAGTSGITDTDYLTGTHTRLIVASVVLSLNGDDYLAHPKHPCPSH